MPRRFSNLDGGSEKAELKKHEAALARMRGKAAPLLLGKLHPLPIVEPRLVLPRELDTERLVERRFGRGDMGLELDRVGAGFRGRVDERMRQAERAVMRLRHLGDDEGRFASADRPVTEFQPGIVLFALPNVVGSVWRAAGADWPIQSWSSSRLRRPSSSWPASRSL